MVTLCVTVYSTLCTVVSDWKLIVSLECPVTMGSQVSAEISMTKHPGNLKNYHLSEIPSHFYIPQSLAAFNPGHSLESYCWSLSGPCTELL